MQRTYIVTHYNNGDRRYAQVVVKYKDAGGTWHTKAVKAFGQLNPRTDADAERCRAELERYASAPDAPLPVGTIGEAVWAGLCHTLRNPVGSLPLAPILALRDFAHVAAWVITTAVGDLSQRVNVTQPEMETWERIRFSQWLTQWPDDDQRRLLAYQWRYL